MPGAPSMRFGDSTHQLHDILYSSISNIDNNADGVRVRSAMTRDGRTLDHGTLETIRTMAVARG
jgi:hypothetical protein